MDVASAPYPAQLTIEVADPIDRWRPFVHWFLAIPHFFVLHALGYVSQALMLVGSFVILFTGKLPPGIATLQAMYLRYNNRVVAYAGFFRQDEYPPFAYETVTQDPGDYSGVGVELQPDLGERNRLTSFFLIRFLLAIPHFVVLFFLGIAALVVWIVAAFVVLFTTRWPDGLRDFVLGVLRWTLRVDAYVLLLTDEYPPFSLD